MKKEELIKGHAGDVMFKQIQSIPSEFELVNNKPIAVGSSGHCHVFTGNVERYEYGTRIIYKVNKVACLQHTDINLMNDKTYLSNEVLPVKDHKPHLLPIGIYEFFIQKTYNPYKKLMENVKD